MDKTIVLGTLAVLGLVVVMGVVVTRAGSPVAPQGDSESPTSFVEQSTERRARNTAPWPAAASVAAALPSQTQSTVEPFDEAAFMKRLRDLLGKDPLLAVKLAREGNAKSPNSAEASERAWIVVKSLTDLGMFNEARVEAQIMVDRYRNTSWAEDVQRHVLTPPPGPPERGAE